MHFCVRDILKIVQDVTFISHRCIPHLEYQLLVNVICKLFTLNVHHVLIILMYHILLQNVGAPEAVSWQGLYWVVCHCLRSVNL